MTNINIEYEQKFLKDFVASIKYLKHNHGIKMEHVGELVNAIAKKLDCVNNELYFAGYYANIGLLMLENITNKQEFLINDKEFDILRQHVYYSANFLEQRGFIRSAEIVRNHHEKPNGMGYFAVPNKDKDAAIVNIADEFVGLSSPNRLRPSIVKEVAIKYTMEDYERSSVFTYKEVDLIKETLSSYYKKIAS